MYDVKPQIKALFDSLGVSASDEFPAGPGKTPHITFKEMDNKNYHAMNNERRSEIIIGIDVWHTRSTGELAKQVSDLMASIGFLRVFQMDLNDPSGIKRKTMRFRGVVDHRTKIVHQ